MHPLNRVRIVQRRVLQCPLNRGFFMWFIVGNASALWAGRSLP